MFIYEFVTGGGTLSTSMTPRGSLLREGLAMLSSVVRDLSTIRRVEVLWDARIDEGRPSNAILHEVATADGWQAAFIRCVRRAEATLVIAPEIDGHLLRTVQLCDPKHVRLLSPNVEFVALASDKLRTCQTLRSAGVPTPHPCLASDDPQLQQKLEPGGPAAGWIWKPNDGAGSLGVRRLRTRAELESAQRGGIIQPFQSGRSASVSALCGPTGNLLLPPCWQFIDQDFSYRGGAPIDDPVLIARAQRLAKRALLALPKTVGYVGIDLILDTSTNGRGDVVLEINPRLTTSYVGLSEFVSGNLAQTMIDVANGVPSTLSCDSGKMEFDAEGNVTWIESS